MKPKDEDDAEDECCEQDAETEAPSVATKSEPEDISTIELHRNYYSWHTTPATLAMSL